jgi:hypothetical protein
MKYLIILSCLFLFSCKENKKSRDEIGDKSIICSKVKDLDIHKYDKNYNKYSFGYTIGDNKFVIINDSSGHTNGFKFDNDKFFKDSKNFDDEMLNSFKGLYLNLDSSNASIDCSTFLGPCFNIKFRPETNTVININYKSSKIFLNYLDRHKIIVKEMKENGSFDSIVYVPISIKNIKNQLWSGGSDTTP